MPRRWSRRSSTPRGRPPGPDARPPPALEAAVAPRGPLRRPRLDRAPSRLAGEAGAGRGSAQATLLDYRGAVEALIHRRASSSARSRRRSRLALGARGRAASLPARRRHPDRDRPLLGDRRLRALRQGRPADELSRPRPLRALIGREPPARLDHPLGLAPREAPAGRGRLALSKPSPHRARDRAPPGGPARRGDRDRWSAQRRLIDAWTRMRGETSARR